MWLVPACGMIFILYARYDWMPRNRWFVPLLPFLSLLAGYGICEVMAWSRNRWVSILLVCSCAAALFDYGRVQMFGGEPSNEP